MNWFSTPRGRYTVQKATARRRGIAFNLSFEDWVSWWELALGPEWFSLRGVGGGKHVMARVADAGAYELGNVKCILHAENLSERMDNDTVAFGENSGHGRLQIAEVRDIFLSSEPYSVLVARFGVSKMTISDIRARRTWRRATFDLVRPARVGRNQWGATWPDDHPDRAALLEQAAGL